MSVVCVAWSSHVGALMSAASRPGMPSVRVLSSRMLEEPDGVERCLETMRSATALFVFRTTDALWDQLDEGIRLIGKTVPVVCVSYDPAAWALSSVPVETAQTAYRYLTYGGAENLGNLFRFLDALPNAAAVPEPVPVPWEGLWHPDAPVRAFATVRGYLEWYAGYACERGLSLDRSRFPESHEARGRILPARAGRGPPPRKPLVGAQGRRRARLPALRTLSTPFGDRSSRRPG